MDIKERLRKPVRATRARVDIPSTSASGGRVKRQMEKNQRDFYLNEQVKAIPEGELGEVKMVPTSRRSRKRSSSPRCLADAAKGWRPALETP